MLIICLMLCQKKKLDMLVLKKKTYELLYLESSFTYIDTSAYTAGRYPPELVSYMKGRGRSKVLFGTNYPMITAAHALADLDSLGLDDEAKALFLRGNAERLFNLA